MFTVTFDPTAQDFITEVHKCNGRLHPRRARAVFSQFTCVSGGGPDNPNWNIYEFYIPGPSPFDGNSLAHTLNVAISHYPVEEFVLQSH